MKDFRKTRRKRIEAWLTAAMFLFGTLTGCGSVSDTHGDVGTPNDGKLKVVTTLFPYYDFTRQIAGDAVDLSMVIPAGQDSHSFEPTPADIRLIQNADLLICNGGAMEQWVSQVVASLDSESLKVITMMDYVDTVEEEIVISMDRLIMVVIIMGIVCRRMAVVMFLTCVLHAFHDLFLHGIHIIHHRDDL